MLLKRKVGLSEYCFPSTFICTLLKNRRYRSQNTLLFLLSYLCIAAHADDRVAVLYPEIREPYKQVFLNIVEGVESEFPDSVLSIVLEQDSDANAIRADLNSHEITGIVALGRAGVRSMEAFNIDIPAVVGAVILEPKTSRFSGITQNPSPSQLFETTRELIPTITAVHVVYEPEDNGWIIAQATQQAEALGLQLKTHPVADLRAAAEAYHDVQAQMDKKKDVLWLPVGAPSRDSAILQNILAMAWKEDQIVISSNLADVRRGVLLSLYPDNIAMGHNLARLLKRRLENPSADNEILFVTTLLKAINMRTAEHIGLRLNRDALREFDYVYPPP